jgi:hypothetical protein
MQFLSRITAGLLLVAYSVLAPLCLGQDSAAGVVVQANHGQLGGANVSSGASIFSGDLLQTDEEGQIQIQVGRTKLVLQQSSALRLFRAGGHAVVELDRGAINYATPGVGEELVIFALDVRLVPTRGTATAGQVTVVSRCEVHATSQTGTVEVTSGKETKTVEETKTYSVRSDFGVEYHDSWKPIPDDYPDFDPNSKYHRSHSHGPCGLAESQPSQTPARPLGGHFKLAAAIIGGGVTCLALCRDFVSPDKPTAH